LIEEENNFRFSFFNILLFSFCAKKKDESLKIGIVLPLSGELSTYGEDCLKGIILRLDEVNKEGGIRGKKLSYVSKDDQGDPLKTAQEVELLS
jgi:ABC-type branched-subunit amino acid transport system substrate-binding protein